MGGEGRPEKVRPCFLHDAGDGKELPSHTPQPSTSAPRNTTMYQVTFSEQSMHELNKLDKLAQLDAFEPLGNLKPSDLEHPREPLGKFSRAGKTLFRLRSGDHRFYFEVRGEESLHVVYILHKNTLEDFLLRTKLPVSENQLIEQDSKFWKYLESLTK
jgi:mRNA-degrading endonuclease RelE of RelBE toxin-antitoxin system